MKKILVVVPDFQLGGVTTSAINFCNELVRQGNEVSLLNMGKETLESEMMLEHGVAMLSLEGSARYWNLGLKDINQAKLLKKIAFIFVGIIKKMTNRSGSWLELVFFNYNLQQKFDVAVAFKQCAPCYYFVLNCVQAQKKIAFVHGDINFMGDVSSWDCYFHKYDYIACVSKAVKSGFEERYSTISKKIWTVYNMLDIEGICRKSQENCSVVVDPAFINIVTIARNENNHKQIDWIPKICAILKVRKTSSFRWYGIGEGPDFESNKQLAEKLQVSDVLSFCGALWNPYPILNACDFLVLPSKTEAYGMVIDEAHILCKPVVATYYPALQEVLVDGVNGLIAKQNVEDLADKIEDLIENKNGILSKLKKNLQKFEMTNRLAYSQFVDMCNYEEKEENNEK